MFFPVIIITVVFEKSHDITFGEFMICKMWWWPEIQII